MDSRYRDDFNGSFSQEEYLSFLSKIHHETGLNIPFRIAETPVFLDGALMEKLLAASSDILGQLLSDEMRSRTMHAVPPDCHVPGELGRPSMIALDFAICSSTQGGLKPMLIELQGFPSLFYYQHFLAGAYKSHYKGLGSLKHLFMDEQSFLDRMRKLILGNRKPEDTVLLELDPPSQNTYVDFLLTQRQLGMDVVCISELENVNGKLFRLKDGERIPVKRIYNRIIFDELARRPELIRKYNPTDAVDVEWVCHPDWYFLISKNALPFLHSSAVPETYFVSDPKSSDLNLSDFVLKPLYSFSGTGVDLDVDAAIIKQLRQPEHHILQRKVDYASALRTPDSRSKVEIRLLYTWMDGEPIPMPTITLARLSQGKMVGVKYNKDKTWVGSSVCLWE